MKIIKGKPSTIDQELIAKAEQALEKAGFRQVNRR